MSAATPSAIDTPAVFQGGRELLSLALMNARNHTLQLLGRFEQAGDDSSAAWIAGHAGWLAEYWIARNPQRALGPRCPPDSVRLASIDPEADDLYNPLAGASGRREAPATADVKAYLLDTLETTLELLQRAPDTDGGLYFYRMALYLEDRLGERLAVHAQLLGVPMPLQLPGGVAPREPIGIPAARWTLGRGDAGFAPAIERGQESVQVPEFEIDAQPATWAQFVEFIDDGGYDREELWAPEGWRWLQQQAAADGRRGPGHVEQIGVASGAVLQTLFGKPTRMGALQAAMHVNWWEADAYARWAGRRLPTEVEWEVAVHAASRRGLRWGDLLEWTAGTLRPWAGYTPDPWAAHADLDPARAFGHARVLRGASFAARARMKHPQARRWALPQQDDDFVGFRTCAV